MRAESLTAAAELELVVAWKAGNRRAGDKLVRAHQPLVLKLAPRYTGRAPLDDLVQEGNLGLIRAMQGFDPARGLRFMTYASWWARAYMQILAAAFPSVVHTPRSEKRPALAARDISLDVPVPGSGGDAPWVDFLEDDRDSPETLAATAEARRHARAELNAEFAKLDERAIDILRRRTMAAEPQKLERIGWRHGISRERVRQIEAKALEKMRRNIG